MQPRSIPFAFDSFSENKHPRDNAGQFTESGGGSHEEAQKYHGEMARKLFAKADSEASENAAAAHMQARSDHKKAAEAVKNGAANVDILVKRAEASTRLANKHHSEM